jgi:glutathione S-transferase
MNTEKRSNTMKLYYTPGTCSFSPHIAIREAGLDVELVRVDLKTGTLVANGSDFTKINPKGYVPVLELDDGTVLTEGPAIVQYIADLKPELCLAPKAGTFERYKLQEWLCFINSEVHKGFSPLFNQNTPDDYKTTVKQNLARRLAHIAKHMEQNNFLMGEQYTVADSYLFTVLNWGKWVGIEITQWPALVDFQSRIVIRPSVRVAYAAEAAQG